MLRSWTGWEPVSGSEEEASDSLTGTFEEETLDYDLVLTILVFSKSLLVNVRTMVSDSERFQYDFYKYLHFFILIDFNNLII